MSEPLNTETVSKPPVLPQPEINLEAPVILDEVAEPEEAVAEPVKKVIDQNVIQEIDVNIKGTWKEREEIISLPSSSDKESIRKIAEAPNVNLTDTPESKRWANILASGFELTTYNDAFVSTLEDQDAEFHQGIKTASGYLAGAHPRFSAIENENVKGERGILRFMSHLGLGTIFQAPLWHTGIWITFKAPSEGELLELQRQLIADKITFGRASYGMVFSNTSSFITDRLITFAFNHIYETTLNTTTKSADGQGDNEKIDLKTIVSSHDIPTVVWGLLCSIYPRGFQYRRACSNDPAKCNHVDEDRLNLTKIQWPNEKALTPWQVTHMSERRANNKTLESVKRYQEEMLKSQNRKVTINKESEKTIQMTLKVPTIAQYVDSGHRWIGEITSMVNNVMGIEAKDDERNEYIMKHGQATAMRQYIHWVENIEFASNNIDDKNTLEGVLDMLSADDVVRNEFMEEVSKYINETSIAVIGIPVYDCPVCNKTQESPLVLPAHTNVIPLDVYQTFFALTVQKLEKIQER